MLRFGRGKGKGTSNGEPRFRQPDFERQNGRGRGSNMTAPAWQTRNGNGFGSFDGAGAGMSRQYGHDQQYAPSMTAPISADEMASPARDSKGKSRTWNFMESGNNKPTSRTEIESWINYNCERSFSGDRVKVDTMVEFFLSSKSASSTFRYLQKVRGPRYFGTFSNYMVAIDNEQLDDGFHDYIKLLQSALYPESGERPLKDLGVGIPDFTRSDKYDNVLTRQYRSNSEFCGGSDYYRAKIEELRELRRKNPQTKNSEKTDDFVSSSSVSESGSGSGNVDVVDIENNDNSPEMSKKLL